MPPKQIAPNGPKVPFRRRPVVPAYICILRNLLQDRAVDAGAIVAFIVGPKCGLESRHSDNDNATSFMKAVCMKRLDVVHLLLSGHSPNINAADVNGQTVLHYAACNGSAEMIKCLVEQGGAMVDAIDHNGRTPLFMAVSSHYGDHKRSALLLLELGANPNICSNKDRHNFQNSPLHVACTRSLVEVAMALLACGAFANPINSFGCTPLDLSMKYDLIGHLGTGVRPKPNFASLLKAEGGLTASNVQ